MPEAFDGKHQTGLELIRNSQHPAGHIAVVRPEMQQRLGLFAADLPGKRSGDAAAIFTNFNGGTGQKILQAGAQLLGSLR
jgi:hypothetical protein